MCSSDLEIPSHQLPLGLTGDSQHFKWGGGVLYLVSLRRDTDCTHYWLTQQMEHPATDPNWLHYHLDMLPYWEGSRLIKEGTTWPSRWIAKIGSKAAQIGIGELRRMGGYLGKYHV